VVYDHSGSPVPYEVTRSWVINPPLPSHGLVELELGKPIASDYSRVDITFKKQNFPHFSLEKSSTPGTQPKPSAAKQLTTCTAKTDTDCILYVSGTFAPGEGTSPSYTIDSVGNYRFFEGTGFTVSATGDINTDNKKTADPDSFHWAIPVQYVYDCRRAQKGVPPSSKHCLNFTAHLPTIGMELDKKGNAVNLVSAPGITLSFGREYLRKDPKHPGTTMTALSVGLDLSAGLEFGSNVKNDYAVANKTLGGQGWFLRGVPSANVYLIIPKALGITDITVSSSYTARIPTTDEVFIETRHTAKPIPELSSNTRNFVQNSLSFKLSKYIAFQIKHQYGALPPAFSFVQNSGSIGLVFSLKPGPPQ
jgi:hypothetical protein